MARPMEQALSGAASLAFCTSLFDSGTLRSKDILQYKLKLPRHNATVATHPNLRERERRKIRLKLKIELWISSSAKKFTDGEFFLQISILIDSPGIQQAL
jgi:hypothetical protein